MPVDLALAAWDLQFNVEKFAVQPKFGEKPLATLWARPDKQLQ
jgi:hypothetical protein